MAKKRTYYWDSGVIIPFFNASFEPERAKIAKELLLEAERGNLEIITSTFTLVEVIKLDRDRRLKPEQEAKIVAFFEKPYIHLVAADRLICESARHLIWKFSALDPKDSVHLASALTYSEKRQLDALFAWDSDFTKLDGKVTNKFPIVQPFVESPSLESWAESAPSGASEPATPEIASEGRTDPPTTDS